MRLLLVGCEYAGTTTLANAIVRWAEEAMGAFAGVPEEYKVHDHFKIPHISHPPDLTDEEQNQILGLSPRLKEMVQRHNVYYHLPTAGWAQDSVVLGLHIEDNVYGPLYFGYLEDPDPNDPIMQTRNRFEEWILNVAPDTVLVLVEASPQVITVRMRETPHYNGVLEEKDVEYVLRHFRAEYDKSRLRSKLAIDTTAATIEESLAEFLREVEPYLTEGDRRRIARKGS